MEKYLTAKEAREMANKWQEVQVAFYIQQTIEAVKEVANKGGYSKSLLAPLGNVSRKECRKILEDLGYTLTGAGDSWNISWLEQIED
jgi:hypothetical protein